MENTSIKSLMKTKQDTLSIELKNPINHPVSKGADSEGKWIEFLRSFLPNKYAVDKGFVFDSKGGISEQIDIIIYDALYAPLVFRTSVGETYITAESVYAVFDSKPNINKETIQYTDKKIKSVTSLYRTRRNILVGGTVKPPRDLTHILGGILAFDSINEKKIIEYSKICDSIDFGCAINKLTFHACRNSEQKFEKLIVSSSEEIIISFFYLLLDELYKLGTVAGLDIRAYADVTLDRFKLEYGEI